MGDAITEAEFRQRAAALQNGLARGGMTALLLTDAASIFYLTGFLTRFWESPTRPWFVVLPVTGAPIAVIPSIGAALMAKTWVRDIRTWDAPQPADDGISLLADVLNDLTPDGGTIGLPMGPETQLRLPVADFLSLRECLGSRVFADATALCREVREVKSEAEIGLIREICAVADRAFDRVSEIAGAGQPLSDVFRGFQSLLLEEGADWVAYLAGGAGQGGYGDVISPASDEPLVRGDILMLDTGAVRSGYFCDFDRNFAIGAASEAARNAYRALFDATDHALAELRPGMTAASLHRLMAGYLTDKGQKVLGGRLGHGLGTVLTEWPSLQPGDETVLREGMVLTLEPGVEVAPGRIMVHEENLVLRTDGAELLSARAAPELPVIDR